MRGQNKDVKWLPFFTGSLGEENTYFKNVVRFIIQGNDTIAQLADRCACKPSQECQKISLIPDDV